MSDDGSHVDCQSESANNGAVPTTGIKMPRQGATKLGHGVLMPVADDLLRVSELCQLWDSWLVLRTMIMDKLIKAPCRTKSGRSSSSAQVSRSLRLQTECHTCDAKAMVAPYRSAV